MLGIVNWPACTSGLTHFPLKRGMSRSVGALSAWLPLPSPASPSKPCLFPVSRLRSVKVTNELHAAGLRNWAPGRISLASSAASAVGPFPPHSASWPSSHLAGCSSWTPLLVPSSRLTSGCSVLGAQSWALCPFLSTLTPMETSYNLYPFFSLPSPSLPLSCASSAQCPVRTPIPPRDKGKVLTVALKADPSWMPSHS